MFFVFFLSSIGYAQTDSLTYPYQNIYPLDLKMVIKGKEKSKNDTGLPKEDKLMWFAVPIIGSNPTLGFFYGLGGTGSIYLTDHDNMLTTGLEVNVKPAGKRIERLSLLSGGERSLAALALLVAIFKARPSPFYVLDEVEAALDDANLGRLLDIFLDLKKSSQLVIITHQKRTMEIADALYGVSMRQDGITQVVGQKLDKAS